MRTFRPLRGVVVAASVAIALSAVLASAAIASGIKVCIPEKEGASIVTAKAGVCKAKYTASTLLPQAEQEKLEQVLPYVKYEAEGIDKKPTVQVSGANVQIVSGAGTEEELDGEGNVIIGYDETESADLQTGSNDLVLGNFQNYTSFGSILGGWANSAPGPGTAVFGVNNIASGPFSAVTGGQHNTAAQEDSAVDGGYGNEAHASWSSITGGVYNTVGGGNPLLEEYNYRCVHYGECNLPSGTGKGQFGSITAGFANLVLGEESSIAGGLNNEIKVALGFIGDGRQNKLVQGEGSAIVGGAENSIQGTEAAYDVLRGGHNRQLTEGPFAVNY